MKNLTVGSIVHYVLESGRSQGQHRPAIVVRDWSNSDTSYPDGTVNLQVFIDGTNDFSHDDLRARHGSLWVASVHHSEAKEPGTWHWTEQA